MGNSATIPSIVSNAVGAPNQNHTGYVVEAAKINTIANILANCVNTTGATSTTETTTPCGRLFNLTANGATPRPSDTLAGCGADGAASRDKRYAPFQSDRRSEPVCGPDGGAA